MRGTIVSGRNSSGPEAATRCYNAEELLYDFLIIIIRNTSRGLLTVFNSFHDLFFKVECFESFYTNIAKSYRKLQQCKFVGTKYHQGF